METNYSEDFLKSLLEKDAEDVLAWTKSAINDPQKLSVKFPWLGLAEVSAFKARETPIEERYDKMAWFETSILIYDWIFLQESQKNRRTNLLSSSIILRMKMLEDFGKSSAHLFMDEKILKGWFLTNNIFSIEDAVLKAKESRKFLSGQLPEVKNDPKKLACILSDIRGLTEIRQKLKILEQASGLITLESEELLSWLAVKADIA